MSIFVFAIMGTTRVGRLAASSLQALELEVLKEPFIRDLLCVVPRKMGITLHLNPGIVLTCQKPWSVLLFK